MNFKKLLSLCLLLSFFLAPAIHADQEVVQEQTDAIAQEIKELFESNKEYKQLLTKPKDQSLLATFPSEIAWLADGYVYLEKNEAPLLTRAVQKICTLFNIALPNICIHGLEDPIGMAIIADQSFPHPLNKSYSILFSYTFLTNMPRTTLEAVIAHELMHLKENHAGKARERKETLRSFLSGTCVALPTALITYGITRCLFKKNVVATSSALVTGVAAYYAIRPHILKIFNTYILKNFEISYIIPYITAASHKKDEEDADRKALKLLRSPQHYRAFIEWLANDHQKDLAALERNHHRLTGPIEDPINTLLQELEKLITELRSLDPQHPQLAELEATRKKLIVALHLWHNLESSHPSGAKRIAYLEKDLAELEKELTQEKADQNT